MELSSESGLPVAPVYDQDMLAEFNPDVQLGAPGHYPFTRGVYPDMYTRRPWTIRQYAGFSTASESNKRYHQLISNGTTGLSVAFDLPTQMGYDSDAPQSHGEVGKVGVAIDSLHDMRTLFDGIPLEAVSTSMTINAPAAVLLLLYQTVAEEQGADPATLSGTIQNDILKEYIARGTYIYPPRPSLRLVADTFAYCKRELPKWNTISISGYHMAEAGATPVQEIAFTLANAKEYVSAAIRGGLAVDEFAPRLSFFFVARTTLLEEVAKFRAARRMWAKIMKNEFRAQDPKSQMLRFHTQTAGVQLTAQQKEVNLARVTIQALAAVLGGTQSLHTNSYDEAIALPSEKAARLALRTQQVIAAETDLTKTVDPFAGSYAIESMTDDIEAAAAELTNRIDEMGGALAAIERGFQKSEIERSAYEIARQTDDGERVVVGVNKYTGGDEEPYEPLRVDPRIEEARARELQRIRRNRDNAAVRKNLDAVRETAEGTGNVLPPVRDALRAGATLGEVCDALREVWGVYRPPDVP
ncbi:methylmalonyl-CoA mutase [Trebonia sp.]|uniref:acyl-CoA mutase large subunit family protein n=1 Tax=Trebonia sp. TaxID=2767075 RepID=UPI00263A0FB4|nr:methylmalonyl-CoA mutase family protein [Trebonia sp.]